MKNKHSSKKRSNKKKKILSLVILGVFLVSCVLFAQFHEYKLNKISAQIQQKCNFVLTVEYTNSPKYEDAKQALAEANQLFNAHHFRDESVQVIIKRAQAHFDALEENPLLNYDIGELEEIMQQTLQGKPGIWSVAFEIPGTDFKLEINNRTVRAASTIKLFNMVTYYDELNSGKLHTNELLSNQLFSMITESSNSSSNAVVTAIGGGNFFAGAEKVTAMAHKLGADNTQEEHMLYDTDTVTPGQNTTSVRDCATVLRKLYFGECVSPEYDAEMIEILKQQKRRFKLPLYLPEGTVVANKTGERSISELDVGIIYSPNCDYILCISVTDFNGAPVRETFGRLSEAVYNYLNTEKDAE